jgi:hypothetical protein
MNERIQELADQAIVPFKDENFIECYHFSKEKFAELIVRECIANCDDLNSMRYIANHFGITVKGLDNEIPDFES